RAPAGARARCPAAGPWAAPASASTSRPALDPGASGHEARDSGEIAAGGDVGEPGIAHEARDGFRLLTAGGLEEQRRPRAEPRRRLADEPRDDGETLGTAVDGDARLVVRDLG